MKQSTRTTIPDPFSAIPVRERQGVTSCIPIPVFLELRKLLCSPGGMLAVTNSLIAAFHKECLRRKIPFVWEPDSEARVTELLGEITFKKKKA